MCSVQPISSLQFHPATKFAVPKRVAPRLAPVTGRVYSPGKRVSTTRANALVPMVIESSPSGDREYDLFSRLLMDRIISINGPIDDKTCNTVNAQLVLLEQQDNSKPIYMYINSPGGSVTAGLSIYDTMQYVKCPISTICIGQAASMGSLLLAAGAKGQRMSLPHSTIMIHQPSGGYQGQARDMTIHTKHINRMSDTLNEIYVKHTGLELDVVKKHMDRDFFLSPEEAKEFGLIDEVITRKPKDLGAGANGVVGLEKPQVSDSDPQDATAF